MNTAAWIADLARNVEETRLGEIVRGTRYLYATIESLHILGIALLVGAAVAVDLRLLGAARRTVPVTLATRHLLPISHAGFAIVLAIGLLMLAGNAVAATASAAAPWKFGLIALAALNILVFHFGVYRSVADWNLDQPTPRAARIAAVASMAIWSATIVAGRFLAY